MSVSFTGPQITSSQVEKIRLILSTYQDGSGQLALSGNKTLPGWRDFERAAAFVFQGSAQESKAIYDVLVPLPDTPNVSYGYQYSLMFPDPSTLSWSAQGRRLIGEDAEGILVEWYGHAGGQFKYYPQSNTALWKSEVFELEPLPSNEAGYGVSRKVKEYYPALWQKACSI